MSPLFEAKQALATWGLFLIGEPLPPQFEGIPYKTIDNGLVLFSEYVEYGLKIGEFFN